VKKMIIDCHNHPDWYGYPIDRFVENMDQYGIDKTWILSWEAPFGEWDPESSHVLPDPNESGPISFSRCRAFFEKAPDRFIPGLAPDPRRPDAVDRLAYAVEAWGVRVCGELKLRMMYDNPDALRMFRFCGEKGLPVLVHIDYEFDTGKKYPRPNWWYGGGISAFERAVAACPDTVFIGHAPGFWVHISGDDQYDKEPYPKGPILPGGKIVDMLERYPNMYCDISAGSGCNALSRDPAFTREFLIRWQDRVMYGRDCFDNRHQKLMDTLDLPGAVLDKIYSGNAMRLVPIRP
jgi:hypothetical protein